MAGEEGLDGFALVKQRLGRTSDKFGVEQEVFQAADGLRVFKHARNDGFGPAVAAGSLRDAGETSASSWTLITRCDGGTAVRRLFSRPISSLAS
jgi:hypothetical protein